MSNPIFEMMGRKGPVQPQNGIMQQLVNFSRTVQGNPEQIVRGLISSGRMSQQQFDQFSQIARNVLPRK